MRDVFSFESCSSFGLNNEAMDGDGADVGEHQNELQNEVQNQSIIEGINEGMAI